MSGRQKVIAVDLDGTLAYYDHWRGADHIGKPIETMVARVKYWLDAGHKVVIFTARITGDDDVSVEPARIMEIRNWLSACAGLPHNLDITNVKRKEFSEFWDDRAVGVVPNTGIRVGLAP
jgi:hypothetical protein